MNSGLEEYFSTLDWALWLSPDLNGYLLQSNGRSKTTFFNKTSNLATIFEWYFRECTVLGSKKKLTKLHRQIFTTYIGGKDDYIKYVEHPKDG